MIINEVSVRRISGGMSCLSERGPEGNGRRVCDFHYIQHMEQTTSVATPGKVDRILLLYSTVHVK